MKWLPRQSLIRLQPKRLVVSRRSFIRGSAALITSSLLLPRKSRAWTHGTAGGGGYVAKAVRFDGATQLYIASLAATDNTYYSFVGWIKQSAAQANLGSYLFLSDSINNGSPSCNFTTQSDVPNYYQLSLGFCDTTSSNSISTNSTYTSGSEGSFDVDVWQCVICSFSSASFSAPLAFGKFYAGDQDVSASRAGFDFLNGSVPFNISSNGKDFCFANNNFGDPFSGFLQGDAADWRIMTGISLLDGSGDIPLTTRRLFFGADGKPVDPAIATAALGVPTMLFSGDATTFGTNQGSGGVFSTTGILTNASTSPSD